MSSIRALARLCGLAAIPAVSAVAVAVAPSADAACLPPSYCGPAHVVLVSRTSTNKVAPEGSDQLVAPAISGDGRYVVFTTRAALVPEDTNGMTDVYRRDLTGGTIARVSVGANGTQGNNDASGAAITADGRYVVFQSWSTNIVGPNPFQGGDILRKDMTTGAVIRANTSSNGTPANNGTGDAKISNDGRYVAFVSGATNLVAAPGNDLEVYRKDLVTGTVVRVSQKGAGTANKSSVDAAMSADGRYIAFTSWATNLAPDTQGDFNVYRKDMQTGVIVKVDTSSNGIEGNGRALEPSISADGRYVAFGSEASNLVAGDTNDNYDIFRKDLVAGGLVRVSAAADGTGATSGSDWPSISADGSIVSFMSYSTNLTSDGIPANNGGNIFRKNLTTGSVQLASTSSAGAVDQTGGGKWRNAISADGKYIAFWSYSALTGGDTNGTGDTYRTNIPFSG